MTRLRGTNAAGQAIHETRIIARRDEGTRRIAGTDWPITTLVEACYCGGKLTGARLTWGLCNGVAGGADEYRTIKAALAAAQLSAGEGIE